MNDIIVKNSVGPVVSVDYSYHSGQQDGNSAENYIFWTDNLQGTLNRAFFNGSCPNNSCVLFRNLGSPEGLLQWCAIACRSYVQYNRKICEVLSLQFSLFGFSKFS